MADTKSLANEDNKSLERLKEDCASAVSNIGTYLSKLQGYERCLEKIRTRVRAARESEKRKVRQKRNKLERKLEDCVPQCVFEAASKLVVAAYGDFERNLKTSIGDNAEFYESEKMSEIIVWSDESNSCESAASLAVWREQVKACFRDAVFLRPSSPHAAKRHGLLKAYSFSTLSLC